MNTPMVSIKKIKKTTKIFFSILFLVSIFITNQTVQATDSDYGTINAYFSKNQNNWEPATVKNISLKRGEIFYIKAEISSKIDLLSIDLKIWETGENNPNSSTFKQLSGPDCFFGVYDIINVEKNENMTLIWKFQVKPDTDWFNATAPLNIFIQYDKNHMDNRRTHFTIVNPYIEYRLWENYDPDVNYSGHIYESDYPKLENVSQNLSLENMSLNKKQTPSFEIIFFITAVSIVYFWKRKK